MLDRVIVCTVTYNSSWYLDRLVRSIDCQSIKVEKIIVIDNASSEEHIKKIRKLEKDFSSLEIVQLKENLGGAGGFQTY